MTLSKRTQYGLRALICLADSYDQGYLRTKELAKREKLPAKFLESILAALARGQFLESQIGAAGGFRLTRPPAEIALSEIIERLEGGGFAAPAPAPSSPRVRANERPGEVGVRIVESQISNALMNALKDSTLAALADQVSQGAGQMYYI